MKIIISLCFLLFCFIYISFAQIGKNGSLIISNDNAHRTIVNEFTSLKDNAGSGSNILSVANSALNANQRFASDLGFGDLILILQMQGIEMENAADDNSYGEIKNYKNCGLYEFQQVYAVPDDTTIVLSCSLKNNYSVKSPASGKVQIVRVPRYISLTIEGVLTTDAWDGNTGGVLVVEVSDSTRILNSGKIIANGLGFRGGNLDAFSNYNVNNFRSANPGDGAEKGEGIAGSQNDYDSLGGRFARGAPANGGGGGTAHNSGGGGGANAGSVKGWTGNGNPDKNAAWANAWNLEGTGFFNSTSSGGGRGGYSFANSDWDALLFSPGFFIWGGDNRRNVGGKGGRPLDYSTGRIFLGGGGGAGDSNDGYGGSGGNGGGLVFILSYGSVSGSGSISANGNNGSKTKWPGNDGAGGGGAGGTVVLSTNGTVSGIEINANGGNGGDQIIIYTESEGPGGGGGGGYISLSNNNGALLSVAGGINGITSCPSVAEFVPNGASYGGDGISIIDTLSVDALPYPTVSVVPDKPNGCLPLCVEFTDATIVQSGNIVRWYWDFGDSAFSFLQNPQHCYQKAGEYSVILKIVSSNGCEIANQFYNLITAYSNPIADFFFSPQKTLISDPTVYFTDQSVQAQQWNWNFGDTKDVSGSNLQNPSHTFSDTAFHCVTLIVSNDYGCVDTAVHCLFISPFVIDSIEYAFYVPNSFSPNNDLINDTFGGKGIGIIKFDLNIFNRWGNLIFHSQDIDFPWDGKMSGKKENAQEDVYLYQIKITDQFQKEHNYLGHLTLIR